MQNETYEIMHLNRKVARIDQGGHCKIYYKSFMPYNLCFEEQDDINTLADNITNFYSWCAARLLPSNRKYAKEILNSAGMTQVATNRERAETALTYHCASLTDVFWVRCIGEKALFCDVNLYDNYLEQSCVDIALKGRRRNACGGYLARDFATGGHFPKAWQRKNGAFRLLKGGGEDVVERELLASRICRCFNVSQVLYEEDFLDGEKVVVSDNMTSKEYSIATLKAFEICSGNHGRDTRQCILQLDSYNYYMMNIIDYLVGNTDRHGENWGVFVDNSNNKPICLHKLMDFNRAFDSYGTMEGADCQTVFGMNMTQKEAALQAVGEVGLNQVREVEESLFAYFPQYYGMFVRRLALLKQEQRRRKMR